MKVNNKQKGVALFVTLLVVTIASLLATEIWFNNNLDISRQYNNRSSYQANHYANGMALWAKDMLREDYEQDANFDNYGEIWNQPIVGVKLDDAVLSGELIDLDSKFNLNNLYINGEVDIPSHKYFLRILANLELDISLADKIIDWLDDGQTPRAQGAEDIFYLSNSPSYRTAGQHFIHISELRLIDGIDQDTYKRLISFVTVLPVIGTNPIKLNINTASTLLIKSLDERITTKIALKLYNEGNAANKTIQDFFQQRSIQYMNLDDDALQLSSLIATKSQWFQAKIIIKMEHTFFQKYAILFRGNAQSRLWQWSDTPFN